VKIVPITLAEKPSLLREMQDYIREMSAFDPTIEAVDGMYEYPYLDAYWSEDTRWPFWIVADGERAGFALLRRTEEGPMEMAEFYMRPAHRRSGIGMAFARDLIARHSGHWIISEYRASAGAIAFWRRVIEARDYSEREYVSDHGNLRIEQKFVV
jgi:predicted acetyltransferase